MAGPEPLLLLPFQLPSCERFPMPQSPLGWQAVHHPLRLCPLSARVYLHHPPPPKRFKHGRRVIPAGVSWIPAPSCGRDALSAPSPSWARPSWPRLGRVAGTCVGRWKGASPAYAVVCGPSLCPTVLLTKPSDAKDGGVLGDPCRLCPPLLCRLVVTSASSQL